MKDTKSNKQIKTNAKARMFALQIVKTYLFGNATEGGYYRWVCKKIELDTFSRKKLELYSPFYRTRRDVVLAVGEYSGLNWANINPFATELFKQHICGDCIIHFEELDKNGFDIWCEIIKKDLQKLGAKNESFEF